ncbi:MAG: hypothetical protein IID18_08625 [Nitrospinae bacterium]|nr:hypothetical protein [Nitrospinota bacterium]
MTDYVSIQNAVRDELKSDAWLSNSANVKTIESNRRAPTLNVQVGHNGFDWDEMPAVTVMANSQPKTFEGSTTREIREGVFVDVEVITRTRDEQTGMDLHLTIVKNVERVAQAQRTSTACWGVSGYTLSVGTVPDEDNPVRSGDYFILKTNTEILIELTATF